MMSDEIACGVNIENVRLQTGVVVECIDLLEKMCFGCSIEYQSLVGWNESCWIDPVSIWWICNHLVSKEQNVHKGKWLVDRRLSSKRHSSEYVCYFHLTSWRFFFFIRPVFHCNGGCGPLGVSVSESETYRRQTGLRLGRIARKTATADASKHLRRGEARLAHLNPLSLGERQAEICSWEVLLLTKRVVKVAWTFDWAKSLEDKKN